MGAKPSTANGGPQSPQRAGTFSTSGGSSILRTIHVSTSDRQRARSLSSVPDLQDGAEGGGGGAIAIAFPGSNVQYDMSVSPDSSSADDANALGRVYTSLPSHIQWSLNGIKCPVCSKFILPDDIECHLVMCLTKPLLSYNEDVLNDAKGECVICLEDLAPGNIIARLPCLCIYHKSCIDRWFEINRSCPEHPGD